jgi:small subunit ribosomal protein S17
MSEQQEKHSRIATGKVVSDKNDRTIVVEIERWVKDPLYGKYSRKTRKFHAHDEKSEAKMGNVVKIRESRPHSKMKRWELVEIISEN